MSEREFQKHVVGSLKLRGYIVWVVPNMRMTVAGVPDLTFWHPSRPGRLFCWELKSVKGKVRREQMAALAHLATVPGVDVRIVRPADWERLKEVV